MLLSPVVTGHCQGQLLLLWQNPVSHCLRGYHPLRQHVPEHFSSENGVQRHSTPHLYHVAVADSVWALPFSLAATSGISIDFSSSSYSDASLRTVRPPKRKARECKERPHSDISGSTVACTYPELIAACLVLHHLSSRVIPQPASLHYTRYTIFLFTIAAPETLREHFRKATIFTLSVITLTSWHVSCNPIHDGHCGLFRYVHHSP